MSKNKYAVVAPDPTWNLRAIFGDFDAGLGWILPVCIEQL
jgi:hypothetical protein